MSETGEKKLGACAFTLLLFFTTSARASNHYVSCSAVGSGTGANWANAYTDLPASLMRGDTYYVAGSNTCTYRSRLFDDAPSEGAVISILGATSAVNSSVTGWSSSMDVGKNPAIWTIPDKSDSQSGTNPIIQFCNSNYVFDGVVGNATGPTPEGQGFVIRSKNYFVRGLLAIQNNGCSRPSNPIAKIAISHTEVNGVDQYLTASITRCEFANGIATVSLFPTPSWRLIEGDVVDLFTSVYPQGITVSQNNSVVSVDAAGSQYGVSVAQNPCLRATGLSPSFGGSAGLYVFDATNSVSYANLLINNNYIHDLSNSTVVTANLGAGTVFTKNRFARIRYTPTAHANGWDDHVSGGLNSSNVTVSFNTFEDIAATAQIAVFNLGSRSGLGTDSNWSVFGNIFFLKDPVTYTTSQGITCFGVSLSPVACSHWKIFNNTFYNFSGAANGSAARVNWANSDPSSIDIEVYNNMWVNCFNVMPTASFLEICTDANASCAATAQLITDYNYYSGITGQSTPAESHIQALSSSPFVSRGILDFHLMSGTSDGLHLSQPFDFDADGNRRGAFGRWDRGAFQYVGGLNPPTNLQTNSH